MPCPLCHGTTVVTLRDSVPCAKHAPRQLKLKRRRQNRWVKAQRRRVPLELTLEKRCVAVLEAEHECLLVKFGLNGWPDRLVLLGHGRHCWFEFKRRKFGSLTPAQRRLIPKLRARGERVYVVRSLKQALAAIAAERSGS